MYESGMADYIRFHLEAQPFLRIKGKADGGVAFVEFRASCDGYEERVWRVEEWYLPTLFDIMDSPDVVAELLCELREGRPVKFPGDYSGTQLVLLGYRMAMRKPPQSAFVRTTDAKGYGNVYGRRLR